MSSASGDTVRMEEPTCIKKNQTKTKQTKIKKQNTKQPKHANKQTKKPCVCVPVQVCLCLWEPESKPDSHSLGATYLVIVTASFIGLKLGN